MEVHKKPSKYIVYYMYFQTLKSNIRFFIFQDQNIYPFNMLNIV